MKSSIIAIATAAIVSTVVVFAVIMIYWVNFRCYPILIDTSKWGAFGDYFGGILNPLIGIGNLMALIYLSFKVSEVDGLRNANDLKNQKDFALYSLQHDALKDISKILLEVQSEVIKSEEKSQLKLVLVRNDVNFFIDLNKYLFPSLGMKIHEELLKSIMTLSGFSGSYLLAKTSNNQALMQEISIRSIAEMEHFNTLRSDFITRLQGDINT